MKRKNYIIMVKDSATLMPIANAKVIVSHRNFFRKISETFYTRDDGSSTFSIRSPKCNIRVVGYIVLVQWPIQSDDIILYVKRINKR